VYLSPSARKLLPFLGAGLLLAGCGGGGSGSAAKPVIHVSAPGSRFSVPAGWKVTRTENAVLASPPGDKVVIAGVYRFPTLKPYRPDLWPRVSAALDRDARDLARQLKGKLVSSADARVAGIRARQYDFEYGDRKARIMFLYRGRKEFELYCRWSAHDDMPDACTDLATSFRPV
jgi:hypothetical protein